MHSIVKVHFAKTWGCLAITIQALGLLQVSSAQAFSISPLRIEANRGQLQIGNSSDRSIKVQLQVFSPRKVDGINTAGLEPLPEEQADQWIQLKPSILRIGPSASHTVSYRIINPSKPFYVCGTTLQTIFYVRVCSRWAAAPSSSASAHRMP